MQTEKVRSLKNIKHDGDFHLPGTTWQCPVVDLPALLDSGSVERCNDPLPALPSVSEMKKDEIIKELADNDVIFDETETAKELREILTMFRASRNL